MPTENLESTNLDKSIDFYKELFYQINQFNEDKSIETCIKGTSQIDGYIPIFRNTQKKYLEKINSCKSNLNLIFLEELPYSKNDYNIVFDKSTVEKIIYDLLTLTLPMPKGRGFLSD